MTLNSGITFGNYNEPREDIKIKPIINTSFFTNGNTQIDTGITPVDNSPKKRGRPKKSEVIDGNTIIVDDGTNNTSSRDLNQVETNTPYIDSYNETNNMLKASVMQIDMLQGQLSQDLGEIRGSKTLKKKYDYISMIGSTLSTLIGTKVTTIREINKTITDCHNLEFKKAKELKATEVQVDDTKLINDMYKAFVSTPVGAYNGPMMQMPSAVDLTMMNGVGDMSRIGMVDNMDQYNNNLHTISPEMNMMLLESNPNVKTVFILDDSTGAKWFDVIDVTTGQSVPNTTKPDPMFIDNITIDRYNKIARDTNLNNQYDLIILNEDSRISSY